MSAAVNSYSITPPLTASVPPMPTYTASAGSEGRRRSALDDRLHLSPLPTQFPNGHYPQLHGNRTHSPPALSSGTGVWGEEWQRKYNTAPASPHHHDYHTVTPKNSPSFSKAQLDTPGKANRSGQDVLPSLRHLQLLPDPRIQEYAYIYPDTSEFTPWWKRNLVNWCKTTNYHYYAKIMDEIAHDKTQLSALLRGKKTAPSSQSQECQAPIPSVLEPKDTFKGLSNYTTVPITPPMSPSNDENPQTSNTSINFTPFVSDKLVQTVKKELSMPNRSQHKKTNSFKAMQLKRLIDNRDVLSINSRPTDEKYKVTKPTTNTSTNAITTTTSRDEIIAATLLSAQLPTPSRSNRSIGNATKQLAFKTDATPTKVIDTATPIYTSTPVKKNRSRSISPMRPTTPPHVTQTSKYHRFSLDSPQSPVVTSMRKSTFQGISAKTSPTKRLSSTTGHGSRKCVSCHSSDSPCWRPSWSGRKQDQLCNSCGLRYKKTHTRCLNESCRKIPTKGELSIMKANGIFKGTNRNGESLRGYRCLFCNDITRTES